MLKEVVAKVIEVAIDKINPKECVFINKCKSFNIVAQEEEAINGFINEYYTLFSTTYSKYLSFFAN